MSFLMSFLKKRLYLGIFLILTIALWSLPTTALADSGTATVSLNAGALTEIGDFSHAKANVTLVGLDINFAYPLGIQVTDATGSGNGWNLQISGTPLRMALMGTRRWPSQSLFLLRWRDVHQGALALLRLPITLQLLYKLGIR